MQLKNVVLPAPFGPMMLTMERSSMSRSDRVDGGQPAEALGDLVGAQTEALTDRRLLALRRSSTYQLAATRAVPAAGPPAAPAS